MDAYSPLRPTPRSARIVLLFPVSRTSPVCLASVLSIAACQDTFCLATVSVVSPRKRTSPGPTPPYPRTTRSTCRRYATDSSTVLFEGSDRQLLLTRYVAELSRQKIRLDYPDCLHDVQHLKIYPRFSLPLFISVFA